MAQIVIENPVLNSPFEEPQRHFKFNDDGITDEIAEGRRRSSYFVPIARPRRKGVQPSLYGDWTQDRLEETKLVNDIRQSVADLIPGFKAAENDTIFVENNLGSMTGAYVKKSELLASIADSVFNMPVGAVFGPYFDGSSFKAVKMLGRKVVPDSVKARHILRPATDQASLIAAQKTIDSLK
ncbi:MAG: hypothetical protein KAX65_11190, partial [Caldilineaceae bacterium]|nr:hypothetical protein [Caldilineaceae bacterium]